MSQVACPNVTRSVHLLQPSLISQPRVLLICSALWACSACASSPQPPAPQHPNLLNDTACNFVGLEAAQGESDNDHNADSVTLFAVYRFPESRTLAPKQPLALKFQVNRARVNQLRDHLSARPEVICSPDGEANYSAHVEPFEGMHGVPTR